MPRHIGTPNRITSELREKIKTIIESELEKMDESLSELSARDRLEIVIKLMKFAIPHLREITQMETKEAPSEIKVNIVRNGDI